jgi:hypothetical protein
MNGRPQASCRSGVFVRGDHPRSMVEILDAELANPVGPAHSSQRSCGTRPFRCVSPRRSRGSVKGAPQRMRSGKGCLWSGLRQGRHACVQRAAAFGSCSHPQPHFAARGKPGNMYFHSLGRADAAATNGSYLVVAPPHPPVGESIPSRRILEMSVVRGMPRRAAAPCRPPTTHFTSSKI